MAGKQNDDYQAIGFYKMAAGDRKRGFVKFTEGDLHYFTYLSGGEIALISQGYTSVAGRDNGVASVTKNMKTETRYRFSDNAGKHGFGLFAGNGQEIAISPTYDSEAAARRMAARAQGKAAPKPTKAKANKAKPTKAKPAKISTAMTDGRIENYKPLSFYQTNGSTIDDGFGSFSHDNAHFFTYHQNGKIVLISESYTSKSGRDNGIKSVRNNMPLKTAYQHYKHKNGKYYFDLNAANKQEIATSVWYSTSAAAMSAAATLRGDVMAKPAKATAAKTKVVNVEDNYRPLAFYEKHGNAVASGFDTFEHDGAHYFTYNQDGKIVLISEGYPTKGARDTGQASTEKNMKLEKRYDYRSLKNGKYDYRIKAGNGKEVARSIWYGSAAAAAAGAAYLWGGGKKITPKSKPKPAPIAALAPVVAAAAVSPKPAARLDKDDDYLACKEYHDRPVNDTVNNVALFKHENGNFYFVLYDDDGDVRLRSEGFLTATERDQELSGVLRLKDDERYYKKITKSGHYMDVLYDETGREVGRSCLKTVAPVAAPVPMAPIVAVAAAAAVAPAVAAAPAATIATTKAAAVAGAAATGGGLGWLKWLLLGLLALLAIWGLSRCLGNTAAVAVPPPAAPEPAAMIACWDGSEAQSLAACPAQISCWDDSSATSQSACPIEPAPAAIIEPEPAPVPEPIVKAAPQVAPQTAMPAVMGAISRLCGPSNTTLFNVPSDQTPISVTYLGSNPQFGDSHGLSPSQFYDKLNQRYSSGGTDRSFLNYMALSLGYAGFRAMDASMFSEDVLAFGDKGLLGLGQQHALQYSSLDTNERDRQAFRVRAASGEDVHFMKTCGNFMYVCN